MFFFLDIFQGKADMSVVENVVGKERFIIGNILNIVRIFGTGLALIMFTWMSISYFSANGKGTPFAAERQADIKGKELKNFVIGLGVFIGAGSILNLVVDLILDIL